MRYYAETITQPELDVFKLVYSEHGSTCPLCEVIHEDEFGD